MCACRQKPTKDIFGKLGFVCLQMYDYTYTFLHEHDRGQHSMPYTGKRTDTKERQKWNDVRYKELYDNILALLSEFISGFMIKMKKT